MKFFADTSFYQANFNSRDQNHRAARRMMDALGVNTLITTEWVFAELLNSFARTPASRVFVADFVKQSMDDPSVEVIPASHDQFLAGLALYAERSDKAWSLIDCISFQLMRDRKITHALSFDDHFWQAGFHPLS